MVSFTPYIVELDSPHRNIGGKANGLLRLVKHNMNTPKAYVCVSEAFDEWKQNPNVIRRYY